MIDEFIPPINNRSERELLEIVGSPTKWHPRAVVIATNELQRRNVDPQKTKTAKYLALKRVRLEAKAKANLSYDYCDFILEPFETILEILISWDLRKDGYIRKAEQQRKFRIVIGVITVIVALFACLFI